jgi:hypothetical protein
MKLMRGDMGGAATVLATLLTIAKLRLPMNVVLATPLTENLPGETSSAASTRSSRKIPKTEGQRSPETCACTHTETIFY